MPEAIPAATLVLFRDRAGAPPELLIVERAKAMAFAGGALVFPGGRIDAGDRALALELAADPLIDAARIAAIREMIEEAGVAVGLAPHPTPDQLTAIRVALHAGETLGAVLDRHGLTLDLAALEPFARWRPAHLHMRIFDTLFFLAAAPADAAPRVDGTENSRAFWASAAQVLAEADAGRATIIFPTRRNLERLVQFADFAEAVAHARRHPVETITPWVEARDGADHLCIPEGLGYPVTSEAMSRVDRG
ncbi:MAG: NUDIX hydrolase [Sphingomonas sp.]|nr:NUDIX hydrolase [Sphingomonas sp.]